MLKSDTYLVKSLDFNSRQWRTLIRIILGRDEGISSRTGSNHLGERVQVASVQEALATGAAGGLSE